MDRDRDAGSCFGLLRAVLSWYLDFRNVRKDLPGIGMIGGFCGWRIQVALA